MSRSRLAVFFLVCALAQGQAVDEAPCSDLLTCVTLGVDRGLQKLQDSSLFPLMGKRLVLERREDLPKGQQVDLGQGSLYQRASRLLDTHNVRATLTKSLSLRLFKTPQGPFDISLDVAPPQTDVQGKYFLFVYSRGRGD